MQGSDLDRPRAGDPQVYHSVGSPVGGTVDAVGELRAAEGQGSRDPASGASRLDLDSWRQDTVEHKGDVRGVVVNPERQAWLVEVLHGRLDIDSVHIDDEGVIDVEVEIT